MTARSLLLNLSQSGVPREELTIFASLARRAGLATLAIQQLKPVVYSHRMTVSGPTPVETAEYAANLIAVGAIHEAKERLRSLRGRELPVVFLLKALAAMEQWELPRAIRYLRVYLKGAQRSSHQVLVARLKLAEALIHQKHYVYAQSLLREASYEISLRKEKSLLGKALQLNAQCLIMQGAFEEARACLVRASSLLEKCDDANEFMVRKWHAILQVKETRGSRDGLTALAAIRQEAIERSDWSTARDCDRFQAVATRDVVLFLHVYFGSPLSGYRRVLLDEFPEPLSVPCSYVWTPGGDASAAPELDLANGRCSQSKVGLRYGDVTHRLLAALCSDFYQPFALTRLHHILYPEAVLNPLSSPARLYNAIKRARQWLKSSGLPVRIEQHANSYRIALSSPCRIAVAESPSFSPVQVAVSQLRARWGGQKFSSGDAKETLSLSATSVHRILCQALEQNLVTRSGRGPKARYECVKR